MGMHRWTRLAVSLTAAGGMIGVVLATPAVAADGHHRPSRPAAAAAAAPVRYVALGDSYTSGPLILPVAAGAPLDCLQSGIDYPHLVAAADGLDLTDRSCSGATTEDMTTAQHGDQSPQFDSLSRSTGVVTIGIGGNDNGLFVGALATCFAIDIFDPFDIGSPCKAVEGARYADDVAADAKTVGAAFARIRALAPEAKVLVVGYPDILPQHGNCYPTVPLTSGDVAYLNGVERDLDSMLQTEAAANGATYVDTYDPSIGHDACQSESVRWIEPPIPSTDAFPVHPNSRGEAADGLDVEAALHIADLRTASLR